MDNDFFLEPQKYFQEIKESHKENVESFFDGLVKKANIDIEANRETIQSIENTKKQIEIQNKRAYGKKTLKNFFKILGIVLIIASAIACFYIYSNKNRISLGYIFLPIILITLSIILIIVSAKKITPLIDDIQSKIDKLNEEHKALSAKAEEQMRPLNDLFDWNIPGNLFSKTIPIIKIDPYFTIEKYQHFKEVYGFKSCKDKDASTLAIISGSVIGNPFIVEKTLHQFIGSEIYTGSLIIHWTTMYKDSNGHRHTVPHTQTLIATLEKPKPFYATDTKLIYGNEAADKLSFSRTPTETNKMNEKQFRKYVNDFDKKLDKLTQKSIKKNENFHRMSNAEFEAAFNSLDRDNNVEYRLLFTPLAQENMINLLRGNTPFGDDFSFKKDKKLNYIKSSHSQHFNYTCDPSIFAFNNYDMSKEFFSKYNLDFLTSLYFDLAPLISIPLYQQHKAAKFVFKEADEKSNIPDIEAEVIANSYSTTLFAHPESATDVILKSSIEEKRDGYDIYKIFAYSFKAVDKMDLVPTLGGDGRLHPVPVHWIEYLPIEKVTELTIQSCDTTKHKFDNCYRNGLLDTFLSKFANKNDILFKRGLISFVGSPKKDDYSAKELNKILINKEEK